jgi:17 kDa outer membrane surface antigen
LRCFAGIAAVCCGLAAANCSVKLQPLSSKDQPDVEETGSIARPDERPSRIAVQPSEADLVYAREAAAEVLGKSGKDTGKDLSVPWENPNSGAGGNITPLANATTEDGMPCRDFLASYVHGGAQDWLQGVACRTSRGTWEVKRLKPLKQV